MTGLDLVGAQAFRFYWLSLNLSYVMEFFTQTLVKRGYMPQSRLLLLTQLLMVSFSPTVHRSDSGS
jgi:hypothetical protein